MSAFRNPVGPQPPRVYWRRRALVALGALVVLVVVVLIVVRPGRGAEPVTAPTSGAAGAASGAEDSPTAPASNAAEAADGSTPACSSSALTLVPVTDKDTYAPGEQPQLSLTVTNTGSKACSIDAGSDVQEYVITSGSERIWSSKDCQQNPVAATKVLQPGQSISSQPFPWDRTRSSADSCDGDRPQVTAGGASYHLTVTIGSITSKDTKQFILQ